MTESCQDCVRGVLHEGEPSGEMTTLAGIPTYIARAEGRTSGVKRAVLYLGDIYGHYNNSKLMADSFARELGCPCYFPDIFNGDPVPTEAMNPAHSFDRATWFKSHTPKETRPPIDNVLRHLREELGVERIAAVGYCFGGRYTVALAIENAIEGAMIAHPAGVAVPDDLNALLDKSRVPLLINACETDQTWPRESQDRADELLGRDNAYQPGFKQVYHPGCTHGFACRGDVSIPAVRQGKERAFSETVGWFKKYL